MARDIISAQRGKSLERTHGGPAILAFADIGTTFPTRISEIVDFDPINASGQFTLMDDWTALGITRGGITISRGFEKIDRDSDQSAGVFDHRPSAWTTTVQTELMETDLAALSLAWGGATTTENASTIVSQATTVATGSPVAAGATTITVTSATNLAAGDILVLDVGSNQEYVKVASLALAVLTLTAPTQYAHAALARVRRLAEVSMTFGTKRIIDPKLIAVIAPLTVESPTVGGVLWGARAHVFRRAKLDAGQRQIQFSNSADWSLPLQFVAFPDLEVENPDEDTFTVLEMKPV